MLRKFLIKLLFENYSKLLQNYLHSSSAKIGLFRISSWSYGMKNRPNYLTDDIEHSLSLGESVGLPPAVRRTRRWTQHYDAEMFDKLLICDVIDCKCLATKYTKRGQGWPILKKSWWECRDQVQTARAFFLYLPNVCFKFGYHKLQS